MPIACNRSRLAESRRGVEEQGVVSLGRHFCDRKGSGVCQVVSVTDDELVEAVARVEGFER